MRKPNPILAVVRDHLTVTVPVVVVIVIAGFIGRLLAGTGRLLLGFIIGAGLAWPCWSFLVPRWRDWVEENGLARKMFNRLPLSLGRSGRELLFWAHGVSTQGRQAWMVIYHFPESAE